MGTFDVIPELFGRSTRYDDVDDWSEHIDAQHCRFVGKGCYKTRKSQPEVAIGTCAVGVNKAAQPVIICPNRFLERNQVFFDCLHLLAHHEPGNELHVVSEYGIPGGSVDYVLVSSADGRAVDFVGIEFQALDTTGSVWPHRQAAASDLGCDVDVPPAKSFGANWKMTAKTILMQLLHKLGTFQSARRHLVCVLQLQLFEYFESNFVFSHIQSDDEAQPLHFHSYQYTPGPTTEPTIRLAKRSSTDEEGLALGLGLKASADSNISTMLEGLSGRLSESTLLTFG